MRRQRLYGVLQACLGALMAARCADGAAPVAVGWDDGAGHPAADDDTRGGDPSYQPDDLGVEPTPDSAPPPDAPPSPAELSLCVLPSGADGSMPYGGKCADPFLWFEGPQEIGVSLTRHVSIWNSGPDGSVLMVSAVGVSDAIGGAARFTVTLRLFDLRTGVWAAPVLPLELPTRDPTTMAFPPIVLVVDVSYDATYSGDVPEESLLITTDAAWASLPLGGNVYCRPLVVDEETTLDCYGPLCDCCFISGPDEPPCASML